MATIGNSNSAAIRGQAGALMWQIGKTAKVTYDKNVQGTDTTNIYKALLNLGYSVDGGLRNATSITETSNSTTIHYSSTPAYIKSMLDKNRPIITKGVTSAGTAVIATGAASANSQAGHAWVMDGYGTMEWYREYVYNTKTGQSGYVTVTLNNCLMVHCNLGWDGAADGWYIYGIFDTKNRPLLPGNSSSNGAAANLSQSVQIMVPYR
jgi:hypothetical protein